MRLIRLGGRRAKSARLRQLIDETHPPTWCRPISSISTSGPRKGDTSLGWSSYTLGTWLDVKPILHCHRDVTTTVDKVRGFTAGVEQLFDKAPQRIGDGLDAPSICISYGGGRTLVARMSGLPAWPRPPRATAWKSTCRR